MKFNLIVVINEAQDRLLFCLRKKPPYLSLLNFVGGKVNANEASMTAAYRELFEETGIEFKEIDLEKIMNIKYYRENTSLEIYYGVLKIKKELISEKNPLIWLDFDQNFYDNNKFAGDGNIAHIINNLPFSFK